MHIDISTMKYYKNQEAKGVHKSIPSYLKRFHLILQIII